MKTEPTGWRLLWNDDGTFTAVYAPRAQQAQRPPARKCRVCGTWLPVGQSVQDHCKDVQDESMSQWRPMSEAPKDGTRILTVDSDGNISVGWWEAEVDDVAALHVAAIHRWLLENNKVWHERHEYDALLAKHMDDVPVPAGGFWTNEHAVFDCHQEEKELVKWMELPTP